MVNSYKYTITCVDCGLALTEASSSEASLWVNNHSFQHFLAGLVGRVVETLACEISPRTPITKKFDVTVGCQISLL